MGHKAVFQRKHRKQPSEWEKIIANEVTDKQLISKIYKQLMQLNSRKINDPKWEKNFKKNAAAAAKSLLLLLLSRFSHV